MGVEKFGANPLIGVGEETVWDVGATADWTNTWDGGASILTIASANATDSIDSLGARKVKIYGLDELGHLCNETVTMSGTNSVSTSKSYTFVYRMNAEEVGSNTLQTNAGTISLAYEGVEVAQILPQKGQTLMATYVIPTGMVGVLRKLYGTSHQQNVNTVLFRLRSRLAVGRSWRTRFQFGGAAGSWQTYNLPLPVVTFPAGTMIELLAVTTFAGGVPVIGGFTIDLSSGQVK